MIKLTKSPNCQVANLFLYNCKSRDSKFQKLMFLRSCSELFFVNTNLRLFVEFMNYLNFLDDFEQHFLRCHFKNFPSFQIVPLCSTYIQWLWFLVAVVSSRYVSFIIFMTRSTIRPKNLRLLNSIRFEIEKYSKIS